LKINRRLLRFVLFAAQSSAEALSRLAWGYHSSFLLFADNRSHYQARAPQFGGPLEFAD
jgi:hypothetical protein